MLTPDCCKLSLLLQSKIKPDEEYEGNRTLTPVMWLLQPNGGGVGCLVCPILRGRLVQASLGWSLEPYCGWTKSCTK